MYTKTSVSMKIFEDVRQFLAETRLCEIRDLSLIFRHYIVALLMRIFKKDRNFVQIVFPLAV